jgi:hypothetical protein
MVVIFKNDIYKHSDITGYLERDILRQASASGTKERLFMGQRTLKQSRRALRKTARREKNDIVTRYMTQNWDKVLVSSVVLIRQFNFKNRFQIAMTILFKPIKKPKDKVIAVPDAAPVGAAPQSAPIGAEVESVRDNGLER